MHLRTLDFKISYAITTRASERQLVEDLVHFSSLQSIMETELIANVAWIFATLLVGVIASLIIYARWNYGLLEKMGIPVIKPWLFLGSNYMEPWSIIKDVEISRQAKYGTIYGVRSNLKYKKA
jgi:hypothetical protein